MGFHDQLDRSWRSSSSLLCVGLDPDPARLPEPLDGAPDAVFRFCRAIVDATADLVCAFKPQFAYFASQREEGALERLCTYIRESYPDVTLVLDAKRGDIGSTAEHYAREAFGRYGAHAVTVNPYLGTDSALPYFEHGGGVIALCRTSNPGGDDLQSLDCGGRPLYLHTARMVAERWSKHGDCGLVVGATYPAELADVRAVAPDLPILVPGFGAQGGDAQSAVKAGARDDGRGLMISSSRAIIYAGGGDDFADAARGAAIEARLATLPAGW
jgi:orotidine-5'-phosphate decarboxylase